MNYARENQSSQGKLFHFFKTRLWSRILEKLCEKNLFVKMFNDEKLFNLNNVSN